MKKYPLGSVSIQVLCPCRAEGSEGWVGYCANDGLGWSNINHKTHFTFHVTCSVHLRLSACHLIHFHSVKMNATKINHCFRMLRTNAKAQVMSLRNIPDPSQPISSLLQVLQNHFLLSSAFNGNLIENCFTCGSMEDLYQMSASLFSLYTFFVCSHITWKQYVILNNCRDILIIVYLISVVLTNFDDSVNWWLNEASSSSWFKVTFYYYFVVNWRYIGILFYYYFIYLLFKTSNFKCKYY